MRRLVQNVAAMLLGLALPWGLWSAWTLAWGQPAPTPPTPAQQLEQCQAANIELRKQLAQAMFQTAALEENLLAARKQQATAPAAPAAPAAAAGRTQEPPKKP